MKYHYFIAGGGLDDHDFHRDDEGSLLICRAPEGEMSRETVLTVKRRVEAAPGQAWKTKDPEQLAIAKRLVSFLNETAA